MNKKFVRVLCDVDCSWEGLSPSYRLYVNDELFVERTWIWQDQYLEENIQIQAAPGHYEVRYELLDTEHAKLKVHNLRIAEGPAIIDRQGRVQIYTPER